MTEFDKLVAYFLNPKNSRGWVIEVTKCCGGVQVIVRNSNGSLLFDAVCHPYSYGGKNGLLEVMEHTENNYVLTEDERNCDDVLGYLTAEEIIKRLEKSEVPHE